ncbi:MAG: DUF308 domain-containing protein [Propionibacteriaceae bacterium]
MATADASPVRDQNDLAGSATDPTPRHTGLRVAIGIISIVIGILVIARPVNTLVFVAVLFGIQLLILGIVRIVLGVTAASGGLRVLSIVLGALTVIAGIICFFRPNASLLLIAILLAAGWIAEGISDLVRAFSHGRSGGEKVFSVLLGVVAIIAGLVVAIFPGPSLVLLAQTAGVALLIIGVITLVSAILGRSRTA